MVVTMSRDLYGTPRLLSALLAFFISVSVFAQTSNGSSNDFSVFAPFVSKLHAEVQGSSVRLSWTDSKSIRGPVFVYRSRDGFTNDMDFTRIQGTQVSYGAQSYAENVREMGEWYYLVVSTDETNQKYHLIIPLNNIISVQVDGRTHSIDSEANRVGVSVRGFDDTPMRAQPYQEAVVSAELNAKWPQYAGDSAAKQGAYGAGTVELGGIQAVAQDNFIIVSYYKADQSKNAILYRSIQPIRRFGDLITATVVKLGVTSPYVDYVSPGVPYYYAIVYEEDIKVGNTEITPGDNSTYIPAEVLLVKSNSSVPLSPYGYAGKTTEPFQPVPNPALNNGQYDPYAATAPSSAAARNPFATPAYPPQAAYPNRPATSNGAYTNPNAYTNQPNTQNYAVPNSNYQPPQPYGSAVPNSNYQPPQPYGSAAPNSSPPNGAYSPQNAPNGIPGIYESSAAANGFSTVNKPPTVNSNLDITATKNPSNIGDVKSSLSPVIIREPRVINQDLKSIITNQDDYLLSQIVRGPFMWRDWNASRESFLRFLAEPHSSAAVARAKFYLAQTFYFIGDYRAALQEFLAVQARWPDEIAVWVQASLSQLAN
ncbi:MAG: hypothetical protein Ta2B_09010 [Termitinemataceae bacterium]|nr:MAG: hypothetical protein Ta2B_09010 [Termitinemataceae bacterium]